jgi:hypothetical protein
MNKFTKKMALLVGVVLSADLLIPGVGGAELLLQAVLIGTSGILMYLRQ